MAISLEAKLEIALQSSEYRIGLLDLTKLEDTKFTEGCYNHYQYSVTLGNNLGKKITFKLFSSSSHKEIREKVHKIIEKNLRHD